MREITDSVNRISQLVGAAKNYSQLDRAPFQQTDLHEGLESTLVMLSAKLKGITVVRDYCDDLPLVPGYPAELNQVWTNLIDNAAQATGPGGTITLRTRVEDDHVLVSVGDDGPGVPKELRSRIFEPFFTTKPVGAGTGLGLDISYRVVTGKHGGDIQVHSHPGDTRFEVRLPLVEPTLADAVRPVRSPTRPDDRTARAAWKACPRDLPGTTRPLRGAPRTARRPRLGRRSGRRLRPRPRRFRRWLAVRPAHQRRAGGARRVPRRPRPAGRPARRRTPGGRPAGRRRPGLAGGGRGGAEAGPGALRRCRDRGCRQPVHRARRPDRPRRPPAGRQRRQRRRGHRAAGPGPVARPADASGPPGSPSSSRRPPRGCPAPRRPPSAHRSWSTRSPTRSSSTCGPARASRYRSAWSSWSWCSAVSWPPGCRSAGAIASIAGGLASLWVFSTLHRPGRHRRQRRDDPRPRPVHRLRPADRQPLPGGAARPALGRRARPAPSRSWPRSVAPSPWPDEPCCSPGSSWRSACPG